MKNRRRYLRYFLASGLILLLLSAAGGIVTYRIFTVDLPNIETLRDYRPCLATRVFDDEGGIIGRFYIEKRELVPMDKVPIVLREAIIAAEDANFYHHEGLDFFGILRALVKNIRAGEIVQGGSTITQQVVKSLLLTPERSLKRKIREAILAYRLERSLSKDEILYLYLNQIYFGHGAYGVQTASKNYFGHGVDDVGLAKAALLAGLPQAPSRYSPAKHPERARQRQIYVLDQMVNEGMITTEERDKSLEERIEVLPLQDLNLQIAPYFMDYVREHLLRLYGKDATFCGGLNVYTTLRRDEQKTAQEAVRFGIEQYRKRHADEESEGSATPPQGALISMDLPEGTVRAMVGGGDYRVSQFNRAIHAKRQPGSAIKPFIYAAALDKGYTPASIVVDSPIVFHDPVLEEKWKPKNYSRRFVGPTTLRDALTHSRNVVTIKVLKDIGITYAIRYVKHLGVRSPLSPDLSLALGSSESTLLEMVTAYTVFACQGARPVPLFIHKITDSEGNILEEHQPASQEVLRPQTAFLMTSLMQGVIQEGTGRAVRSLGIPCAGKTGTTNDFRDAWFIGYTPDKIVGVWIGYDQPQSLGERESGGRVAAPVWLHYMKGVSGDRVGKPFPVPPGIVFAKVDTRTGLLANPRSEKTRLECFLEGTEPRESAENTWEQEGVDFFQEEDLGTLASTPFHEESDGNRE